MPFIPEVDEGFMRIIRHKSPEEQLIQIKVQWLGQHHRSGKERREIRNLVADRLAPLLTEHGFLKSCTTFFRIHGDYLLQVVSVIFPSTQEPSVSVSISPLYDALDDMSIELSGTRTGTGWEGDAIELIVGVAEDLNWPSFLAFRLEFDAAIEKELELLRDSILPMLDGMRTANDYLAYQLHAPDITSIFPLLRAKRLGEAKPLLHEWHARFSENLKAYNERRRACPELPEQTFWQNWVDVSAEVIQALETEDEGRLQALFDKTIRESYALLGRYSKALVKRYPLTPET